MLLLSSLFKSYGKGKPILKNVSLDLKKQDFAVIIGNNGAGKSSLLKAISGEISVDKGHIILDNADITLLSVHKRAHKISRVFQDIHHGTIGEMTLEENLALSFMRVPSNLKISSNAFRHLIHERLIMLQMGLENMLHSPVASLSGGQRQAFSLIMATLAPSAILLLDEHTSALDPKTAKIIMDITEKIVTSLQITCFMITHNLKDALQYGNRLIVMEEGQIIQDFDSCDKKNLTIENLHYFFYKEADNV